MATAFVIVDVFADDTPVRDVEYFLAVDAIGIAESVQNESTKVSATVLTKKA